MPPKPAPTPESAPRFRTARDAERYLLGFINYEIRSRYRPTTRTHDLAAFARRLAGAGWEPASVPALHIGGTNAKGTVAVLVERILRAGGLRTGLYTSPHLHSMRERIRIGGRPLAADRFRAGVERLAAVYADTPGAGFRTTFEHLTALALLAFQEAGVERAVIEVGLGGRLDATNVLPPGPVILTPVSLDHRHVLGNTVAAIAADKAHIIKPGGALFLMPQGPRARAPILARAKRTGVPVTETGAAVRVEVAGTGREGTDLVVTGAEAYGRITTRLLGAHQSANVAAAVAAAESLLPPASRRRGVRRGLAGVRVPGRLELLEGDGIPVLVDGGHNPAAARAVAAALRRHFPGARVTGVVGMAGDKDRAGFLRPLAPVLDRLIATAAVSPRAGAPEALASRFPGRAETVPGVAAALAAALRDAPDLVLVAGSFLVAAEARRALGRRRA